VHTSSGITHSSSTSSQDTCAAAAAVAMPSALGPDTYLPATPESAACVWPADAAAAAAALAEAWCDPRQQQQQQQDEALNTAALESLLGLELQHCSSSCDDDMPSDVDEELMMMLEQELLAAAADAGVHVSTRSTAAPTAAASPAPAAAVIACCGWPAHEAAVAAPAAAAAAAPVQGPIGNAFNSWAVHPSITQCAAGAHTTNGSATLQPSCYAAQCAASPVIAAACGVQAAAAMSKSYIQQRLQVLTMQYAQLSQMHAMLTTMQGQVAQPAAAAAPYGTSVHGASGMSTWFPYV
jgi:hypothetical protein